MTGASCFRSHIGIGSKMHVETGALDIMDCISAAVAGWKEESGSDWRGCITGGTAVEVVDQIDAILFLK